MRLHENTKSKVTENINGGNVSHLGATEVVLVQCNFVNDYNQDFRVLYKFVPNKLFGKLIDTSPTNFILLRTFNFEFSYI